MFLGFRAAALHPRLDAGTRVRGLKFTLHISCKSLGNDKALKDWAKISRRSRGEERGFPAKTKASWLNTITVNYSLERNEPDTDDHCADQHQLQPQSFFRLRIAKSWRDEQEGERQQKRPRRLHRSDGFGQ